MNILITGCNGFVGSSLLSCLHSIDEFHVTGICRTQNYTAGCDAKIIYVSDLERIDEYSDILRSTDVIIHTAGKAHVTDRSDVNDKKDYFYVNTYLTEELARKAVMYGVKRFIYLSSIKVFGDPSSPTCCFTPGSDTNPIDFYGESKLEAERKLTALTKETSLEVVIIRPPLVYGPGVKGNMAMLSKLVRSNLPLPFKSVTANRRSMVSIANLNDLLRNCLSSPAAIGQIFLVSDDNDLSTFQIVSLLKKYFGSRTIFFSIPTSILRLLGRVTGLNSKINRLVETSIVDIEHTKAALKWHPPQTVEEAFQEMVN